MLKVFQYLLGIREGDKPKVDNISIKDKKIIDEFYPFVSQHVLNILDNRKYQYVKVREFGVKLWLHYIETNDPDIELMNIHAIEIIDEEKFVDFAAVHMNLERTSDDPRECIFHWKMKE